MRTPEERRRQQWYMLLRCTVLQCHARAGVLVKPEPNGELRTLAVTDGWSSADVAATETLWVERRAAWSAGQALRRGRIAAWPLLDSGGRVSAFVALSDVDPDFTPAPLQRSLFARLGVEAGAPIPRDPLRKLVRAWTVRSGRQRPRAVGCAA
jgi:hypothetical protein